MMDQGSCHTLLRLAVDLVAGLGSLEVGTSVVGRAGRAGQSDFAENL